MEKFLKRLADMIRDARTEQSLTQEKLAAAIGKEQSTVGQYEGGLCKPSLMTLYELIHILKLDANALFYGESDLSCEEEEKIIHLIRRLDEKKRKYLIEYIHILLDD